jgi:hypothetical protein
MSAVASPQLDLTEQPDGGARYRLPRQTDLGARLGRATGLGLVVLLPLLVPLYFVPREYLVLVLSAGGIVLLTAAGIGVWLLVAEVSKSAGPVEVVVGKDGLEVRGGVGPLRWKHRRPLLQIHLLLLSGEGPKEGRLQALCFRDPPLLLARSLPLDVLEPLARDLAGRVAKLDPTRDEAPEVRTEQPEAVAPERQPARSRIIVVEQGGGVVFTVPPVGFRGRVLVVLFAGSLYLLWGVAVVGQALLAGGGAPGLRTSTLFNLLFQWGFGMMWVWWGLNRAVRRVVLWVLDGTLRVEEHRLFGDQSWQWSRDELRSITGTPLGLWIQTVTWESVTINDLGRSDPQSRVAEMLWLAAALQKALGPAEKAGDGRKPT